MKAHEDFIEWTQLQERLTSLEMALNTNNVNAIRELMIQLVSGYVPDEEIVDWVYLRQGNQFNS